MKRLFALLLPLCLLLAGCSRNTQTLQEEVDRLKRENTALLETIDRLQEQLSALQSTSLESWSLEAQMLHRRSRSFSQPGPAPGRMARRPSCW